MTKKSLPLVQASHQADVSPSHSGDDPAFLVGMLLASVSGALIGALVTFLLMGGVLR